MVEKIISFLRQSQSRSRRVVVVFDPEREAIAFLKKISWVRTPGRHLYDELRKIKEEGGRRGGRAEHLLKKLFAHHAAADRQAARRHKK